jgi:hypothetical protein
VADIVSEPLCWPLKRLDDLHDPEMRVFERVADSFPIHGFVESREGC